MELLLQAANLASVAPVAQATGLAPVAPVVQAASIASRKSHPITKFRNRKPKPKDRKLKPKDCKLKPKNDAEDAEDAELNMRIERIAEQAEKIIKLPPSEFQEIIGKMCNREKINELFEWDFVRILIEGYLKENQRGSLKIKLTVSEDGEIKATY